METNAKSCNRCLDKDMDCSFSESSQGTRTDLLHETILCVHGSSTAGGVSETSLVCIDLQSAPAKSPPPTATKPNSPSSDSTEQSTISKQLTNLCDVIEDGVGSRCGQRIVCQVQSGTGRLLWRVVRHRCSLVNHPTAVTFIECTQHIVSNRNRDSNGCLIAFTDGSGDMHLGILGSNVMNNRQPVGTSTAFIYVWNGPNIEHEGVITPALFLAENNQEKYNLLSQRVIQYDKSSAFTFIYLNQVYGSPPFGGSLSHGIVNSVDGKLQCSPEGPDIFTGFFSRHHQSNPVKSSNVLTQSHTGTTPIIIENKKGLEKWRKRLRIEASTYNQNASLWNRAPRKIICRNETTSVAVVRKLNGEDISRSDCLSLPFALRGKYFIPNPLDFIGKEIVQRFYVIGDEMIQSLRVKFHFGVPLQDVDECLSSICEMSIDTVCINDCNSWNNHPQYQFFSHIYGGRSVPSIENSMQKSVELFDVTVEYGMCQYSRLSMYQSLSVSLIDPTMQRKVLSMMDVELTNNAYGKRGMYPDRNRCRCIGHCTYVGNKISSSQSQVTPTEGPGMRDRYRLYRQYVDSRYSMAANKLISDLGHTISMGSKVFMKPYSLIDNDPLDHMNKCRLGIWTIDFANHSHIDSCDMMTDDQKARLLNAASEIRQFPRNIYHELKRLNYFTHFVEDFGLSNPTKCAYQFVPFRGKSVDDDVVVIQSFMMLGIGMSLRLKSFLSHIFHSGCYQHNTSIPLFLQSGKVYMFTHPDVRIAAWGAGKSS